MLGPGSVADGYLVAEYLAPCIPVLLSGLLAVVALFQFVCENLIIPGSVNALLTGTLLKLLLPVAKGSTMSSDVYLS